jgi:hypothetical protein
MYSKLLVLGQEHGRLLFLMSFERLVPQVRTLVFAQSFLLGL